MVLTGETSGADGGFGMVLMGAGGIVLMGETSGADG